MKLRTNRFDRSGTATVELAVVLPLLMVLLIGLWEVSRMVEATQIVQNAAREGARQAATGIYTDSQVQDIVVQYLIGAGFPDYSATKATVVSVVNLGPIGAPTADKDVRDSEYLDQVQVTVEVPYDDICWILVRLISNSTTKVGATAVWLAAVDKDVPTFPEPPTG